MKKEEIRVGFRIEKSLWDAFCAAARAEDTTASREIRRFVREWMRSRRQMDIEDIAKKAAK